MAKVINPATDKMVKEIPDHTSDDVSRILTEVQQAFLIWKKKTLEERSTIIGRVGEVLLSRKEELAKLCTEEMGKTLKESLAEVEKCAVGCKFYAENAPKFLKSQEIKTQGQRSYVAYEPLGIVLAIMPWNFPFWQLIRFAAPGLCAGNGAVLKHSSNTPGCGLALEKVFEEAGCPKNLFRTLIIPSKGVNQVIEHPLVKAVTLTGSTAAGKEVAKKAGECLKKTVLELGGSDPYLILEDADLELAAKTLVKGRLMNAGQSCISPKRLIVVRAVYDSFREKVLAEIRTKTFGDPLDPKHDMGSMARRDLRDEVHAQVKKSIERGAQCLAGGEIPGGPGAFYPPTLLVDVKPGMPAFDEELFGPVVCLIPAENEEDAIRLANLSPYGLGGGIFTQNIERGMRIAQERLDTGGVFINDFLKSDPRLPFGGIKESGYGRELSELGIKEFVNAKTIFVL